MAKLDIGGTQIEIDDGFLKLSPQAQDAFVKNTIIPSPEFQAKLKGGQPAGGSQMLPPITVDEGPPPPPADDHGLARRQAMSPLEKAVSPFTEYPRNYEEMRTEAQGQFGRGLGQLAQGWREGMAAQPGDLAGLGRFAKGAANVGLGALGYTFSPVSAAYRSVAGQPVEDVTGIPREYTEFAAQLATPGIGLTGKASEAMPSRRAMMSEEPPPARPPPPPPADTPPGLEAAQAAQRQGITVPRVLTSDNRVTQQAGQILSKQPLAGGGMIGRAIEDVPVQLGEARSAIADQVGGQRTPGNVASDIRQHVGGAAEAETQAAEAAAREADQAARADWERTNQARTQAIEGYQAQSARETGQQVGDVPTTDMGQTVLDTVRANHEVARNAKDAAYREAGAIDATVLDDANANVHSTVRSNLRSDVAGQGTVDLTGPATKAARSMMRKLDQFSKDARMRVADAQQEAIDGGGTIGDAAATGKNMQSVEQLRQDLNFLGSGADNDADRRAVRRIMGAFDEWHGGAVEHSLMEGSDPAALPAMQRARALNRDYRERFGYNDRNDADTVLNKMVQPGEQIGGNEIAKTLTGAPDKAGRLLDAVYAATGDHPNHGNVVQAVRGGFWNKLTGAAEGVEKQPSPTQIQKDVFKFTRGPGRDVAGRIFTAQDQALMERHANVLTAAERARTNTAALAKTSEPVPTEVPKGPMQQLADRVLGRGQKSDEALYNTIEGYAKSKSSKDVNTLSELMGNLPDELRGNFLNSFIRGLGKGQKDAFSPAIFHKEWSNLTPQTKAVLTGNAGPHVAALDDIAAISKHFDEVHRRFGNPSGSGAVVNFAHTLKAIAAGALTGTLMGPAGVVGGWLGGAGYSKFLSTPQGAASVARFGQRLQRLQEVPTVENAAAARLSMRNLRNTALATGIRANIPDEHK